MAQPPSTDAEKVAALRQLLPATGAGIYLDTATAGPLPAETAAAMVEADEWELRVGRAAAGREEDLQQRLAEARAVLAALLGADPDRLTPAAGVASATLAGLLALDWRRGDRLIADDECGPEVLSASRLAARALDLQLEVVADARSKPAAGARRLVMPAVSAITGRRLASALTAAELGRQGVGLIVDASLLVGAAAVSVDELGAEMLVTAADRWALGPEGTAALWLSTEAGSSGNAPITGRLPRTALLGLARSVGWLEMYVGLEWAFERTARLVAWVAEQLAAVEGVGLLAPPDSLAGIVTFRLPPAWASEEAADELGRRVFAIVPPVAGHNALRASLSWFNSEEELSRFVGAVAELARHTPATLPRRPALTIL